MSWLGAGLRTTWVRGWVVDVNIGKSVLEFNPGYKFTTVRSEVDPASEDERSDVGSQASVRHLDKTNPPWQELVDERP